MSLIHTTVKLSFSGKVKIATMVMRLAIPISRKHNHWLHIQSTAQLMDQNISSLLWLQDLT